MKAEAASRRAFLRTDFFLVSLLTAVLIWPLFKTKYLNKWGSIESTFIAERADEPEDPIPNPRSYRDKWKRRW